MAKTSIIFTRYNNDVRHLYQLQETMHDYILIDDGSKLDVDMPPFWKVYKITEDIGWNSEGAKNLGMHVMETDWGLTCDMDHPPMGDSISRLDAITNILPREAAYNPVRKDGKCINSYLCTKDLWWKVNGYDESFSGYYGYDITLYKAFEANGIPILRLPAISLDIISDGSSMTRQDKEKMQIMPNDIFTSNIEKTDERLRFPWQRVQ